MTNVNLQTSPTDHLGWHEGIGSQPKLGSNNLPVKLTVREFPNRASLRVIKQMSAGLPLSCVDTIGTGG